MCGTCCDEEHCSWFDEYDDRHPELGHLLHTPDCAHVGPDTDLASPEHHACGGSGAADIVPDGLNHDTLLDAQSRAGKPEGWWVPCNADVIVRFATADAATVRAVGTPWGAAALPCAVEPRCAGLARMRHTAAAGWGKKGHWEREASPFSAAADGVAEGGTGGVGMNDATAAVAAGMQEAEKQEAAEAVAAEAALLVQRLSTAAATAALSKGVLLHTPAPAAAAPLTLDRVMGQTCLHNSALSVNPVTGDVAYPAGCVVVIYQPRRNRQFRYFRAGKTVSCLAFSRDGSMLAVGERGHLPSVIVWKLATGVVLAELKGGHKYGVACLAFSPQGNALVSVGFKYDRMLQVWDLSTAADAGPPASPVDLEAEQRSAPKRVACSRLSQRVRAVDFSDDGQFFVTAGDAGHVVFWHMDGAAGATQSDADTEEHAVDGVPCIQGTPASIEEDLRDSTFMDVACDRGGEGEGGAAAGLSTVFCVTSKGILCTFSRTHVMEQWVTLESATAYGVSVQDGMLAAACCNGVIRLFKFNSTSSNSTSSEGDACSKLQYVATLPKPPPLGHANVASLQCGADGAAAAAEHCYAATLGVRMSPSGTKVVAIYADRRMGPSGTKVVAIYADRRMSPSGTKVVTIYADRSFFIWDITDTAKVGKYRSFLNHSACIWDVHCIPQQPQSIAEPGSTAQATGLPDNCVVTCSADNTLRIWDIGALDSAPAVTTAFNNSVTGTTALGSSGRWSNIYSKYLLRILYGSSSSSSAQGDDAAQPSSQGSAGAACGNADEAWRLLSDAIPDAEMPAQPDWPQAPRSLAAHPCGTQVACGDKQGHIRVYDLTTMSLKHTQAAHDAEVLCLSYSPLMVPLHSEAPPAPPASSTSTDAPAADQLPPPPPKWVAMGPGHRRGSEGGKQGGEGGLVLLASAGRDRLVKVFDASNPRSRACGDDAQRGGDAPLPLLHALDAHSSSVTAVKFSKGRVVSAGGDKLLVLSHDGRRLVSAGGDKLLVLNHVRGRQVSRYKTIAAVPQGTTYGLDVDPTDKYMVTAGQDKKLNIWSIVSGRHVRAYRASPEGAGGELYKATGAMRNPSTAIKAIHSSHCKSANAAAKALLGAEARLRATLTDKDTISGLFHSRFAAAAPPPQALNLVRFAKELVHVNDYVSDLFEDIPTSAIRMPKKGTGHKTLEESVGGMRQAVFIKLQGTSFHLPGASAATNMAAGAACIKAASCDLDMQFHGRVKLVVAKLELLAADGQRPNRVDAHGIVVVSGIEQVAEMTFAFKQSLLARGSMCAAMHDTDRTRVMPELGGETAQRVYEWAQYMLKADGQHKAHIDRGRTRDAMRVANIPVIGNVDDMLFLYHSRTA
ncbi:hypothetical protein JKP88DRAFT_353103 [Tribonema minus]|uniref:Uncharacterized protein n=1 Tax=Tribonema minus TaxID=303371 RepID=A0A835ZC14_9STRA|nr:hypothetical protein JKP88DRAFT_353103 [Tribonema minus]